MTIIGLLALTYPQIGLAAITFNAANKIDGVGGTSKTLTLTLGSVSETSIVIEASTDDVAGADITNVDVNGVNAVKVC